MHAEWSVEIGPQSECLEVPWRSEDGAQRFYDLRSHPELLLHITETHENRELGGLLAALNAPPSFLSTAKCDVWATDSLHELNEEERELGLAHKFASYVDVVFSDAASRLDFTRHEAIAKSLCELLSRAPEFAARVECVLRRCFFHVGAGDNATNARPDAMDTALNAKVAGSGVMAARVDESEDGFAVTIYLSGYGADATSARKSWAIALKLLENALRQLNAQAK